MVTIFVAIIDRSWFGLWSGPQPDVVNFWQPSGGKTFRALAHSELFPYKFHSFNDYIVSRGVFSHTPNVSMAWDVSGAKNSVVSLADMRPRIAHYRCDIFT
jgi:putative restriction endonuclease